MKIGGLDFGGPYGEGQLSDSPGVYAVLDIRGGGASYACIDVGESDKVATRVSGHDRKPCWFRNTLGRRAFAVLYMDGYNSDYRKLIEQDVRRSVSPPCGVS